MISKKKVIALVLVLCSWCSIKAEKQLTLKPVKDNNWSLKSSFIKEMVTLFEPDIFIESGTYCGNTVANAIPYFKELYSVELSPEFYASSYARFKDIPNVHLYQGDSSEIFKSFLPAIHQKALFWLDGHCSGGSTANGSKNTPIIEELIAIKNSGIKNAIILIDDMRYFEPTNTINQDSSLTGYPSVKEVRDAILSINPAYHFIIYGDIALAYIDIENTITTSPVIEACTQSRFIETDNDDFFFNNAHKTEKIIASAQNEESETLKIIPELFIGSELQGFGKHFRLWKGLILQHEGNIIEACKNFQKAVHLGYPKKYIPLISQ